MESTRNTKKIVSQIGIALVVFAVLRKLGVLAIEHFELLPASDSPWMSYFAHVLPVYLCGFLPCIIVMSFIQNGTDKREKERVKFSHILMVYFAAGALGTMLINGAILGIITALSKVIPIAVSSTSDDVAQGAGWNSAFAGLVLGAAVAGFGEEFLFRKMLYKKMAGCPDIYYILVSGVTFGIMHDVFAMGIGHCVTGMMFAYIYLRTRSYLTVALLHMFTDSVPFFFAPVLRLYVGDEAGNFVALVPQVIGIIVLLYALVRRRKEFRKHLRPADEDGWEFAEGKWPVKAVFSNVGIALYAILCFGSMIYHLF